MTTSRAFADPRRLAFRAALVAAALAVVTPTSGWALSVPTAPAPDSAATANRKKQSMVQVENNNWLDVHVYMVQDGEPISLGVVGGPGKERLHVPAMALTPGSQVQILILPIGGLQDYLSPPLMVNPGDTLDVTVENDISLSSVTVGSNT